MAADDLFELRIFSKAGARLGTVRSRGIPRTGEQISFRYFGKLVRCVVGQLVFRFDLKESRGCLVIEIYGQEPPKKELKVSDGTPITCAAGE